MRHQIVREYDESSDCLILLCALMTDINFCTPSTPIEQSKSIYVTSEKLSIKHHNFESVLLQDFLVSLLEAQLERKHFELVRNQGFVQNTTSLSISWL